ncbi:Gfo/Idh/MocA family oxidoreductase [Curtobacterium pusillum]|uniref:Gfo/Idh/MocA family oxidoreductase n=1 Tax=Curtobacterium pusillum TaxID=69373 RepID=A0ABX2M9M8_9MICO|nr:Gfo/Idh/MocA family oxidoreductase [Curtobacterium pusillum]NUU12472.1 Gfo/Idh/MocA family oxidoreductase [Curtobacterium pusillum]GLK33153.1 oxidoreductase [Curtobacterium pusillum]
MSSTTGPLRLAVVGAGVIGRHHARVAVQHDDLEIVALVDAIPAAATSAADEIEAMGVARPVTTETIEQAIAETDIDVVAICAPSGMHVQLAEAALAAGKHVVIEKPLDTTMPRAREIARLAREARERGLVTSVISQHRFDPASVAVAQAAHGGGFGTVTSGVASVAWYRSQGYYDSGDWRGTWDLDGGGSVMNQGVHTVDLLVWTLGRPVEISAQTALLAHDRIEVEDTAVATVRFENGALGVIHCTTAAYPGLSARYAVYGTHGSAIVDDDRLSYFHIAPDSATLESASTTANATAVADAVDQKADVVPAEHVVGGPAEPDHFVAGHSRQYADIVAAIRSGSEPGVTVDAALVSLATVRGLYVSATLGQAVRIDDVIEGRYDDVVPVVGAASTATEGAVR